MVACKNLNKKVVRLRDDNSFLTLQNEKMNMNRHTTRKKKKKKKKKGK